jgi:hypothetical protein
VEDVRLGVLRVRQSVAAHEAAVAAVVGVRPRAAAVVGVRPGVAAAVVAHAPVPAGPARVEPALRAVARPGRPSTGRLQAGDTSSGK